MITAADLLLVNANVLTMDPGRPRATAVAITGGRILDLPDYPEEVSAERVVDLRGATVLPGFHDAHNHMTWFGLSLSEVDLRSPGIGSLGRAVRGGGPAGAGRRPRRVGGGVRL